MIRSLVIATCLSAPIAATATAATVAVPKKSAPESITIAPNGDLILGSSASAKIYRAKKGSNKAEVFVDASAEGAVYFLGVLADAPTNTLWACQIYSSPPGGSEHSDLYISDTFGAKIWRLKPGASLPEMFSDDRTLLGIDGITFIGDTLYENKVIFNKLYRVPVDTSGKAGKIDMVTVRGDTAAVTVLKEGLAVPTSIEPAGGALWYGELEADRAHSMPLPK
jgi:hypothetical protein